MDLSKFGDVGRLIDKRSLSLRDAGELLEELADSVVRREPVPLILAIAIAPALYEAAEKAKNNDQAGAMSAIAMAVGLQAGSRRRKAPFWQVISRCKELIQEGDSLAPTLAAQVAEEFGIGDTTVHDYWNKYLEQAKQVCQQIEAWVKTENKKKNLD